MRSSDRWLARRIAVGRSDLDDRQSIIEDGVGLTRIIDGFERSVPDERDRPRVSDRREWRQVEIRAAVPALGDDFRTDTGRVAK